MSKSLKFGVFVLAFALAACAPSDSTVRAAQTEQRTQKVQSGTAFLTSELRPLIPMCLRMLERGTPPSSAKLTSHGFKPAFSLGAAPAFRKRQVGPLAAQTRAINTVFAVSPEKCDFSLISVERGVASGQIVRKLLEAEGYRFTSSKRYSTNFAKGAVMIEVSSLSKNSTFIMKIEKPS